MNDLPTQLLALASETDDKYSRGCVGFITGSERYPGAALLGIRTALNLGLGMVRYLGPPSVAQLVLLDRPEVVLGMDRAQCWVVGSGIADEDLSQAANLVFAVSTNLPLVIDAGALQQLDFAELKNPSECLLTPHHREAARLLGKLGQPTDHREIDEHPEAFALELNRACGVPVLLKSSQSVLVVRDSIDQPHVERLPAGHPHLASAGSGDVLAAILGALIARSAPERYSLIEIVKLAAQLHSLAASLMDNASELGSSRLADYVGKAANQLRRR